jgi:hypothetical protein
MQSQPITDVIHTDISTLMNPGAEKRQPMAGFDADYVDMSIYGEPTGKRTFLLGITHQEIREGKFVQEWSCFDEFALLKQLYIP